MAEEEHHAGEFFQHRFLHGCIDVFQNMSSGAEIVLFYLIEQGSLQKRPGALPNSLGQVWKCRDGRLQVPIDVLCYTIKIGDRGVGMAMFFEGVFKKRQEPLPYIKSHVDISGLL